MKVSIFLVMGIALACLALGALWVGDSVLADARPVTFTATTGDTLSGTFFGGASKYGVVLAHGFTSTQATMRPLAVEFARAGVHVLTFDFSGHGDSGGGLTFDNAQTDRMAQQVLGAKAELKRLATIDDAHIVMIGTSMGARAILQGATLADGQVAGLILLGTQLNLSPNLSAQFFTDTADADLAWVQRLSDTEPPTNITLISTQWDVVLPPTDAHLLLQTLLSDTADVVTTDQVHFGTIAEGTWRELAIFDSQIHNYQIYDAKFLDVVRERAGDFFGTTLYHDGNIAEMRPIWWLMGLSGVFMALLSAWYATPLPPSPTLHVHITQFGFFVVKLVLWLVMLPFGVLLAGAFFVVPLPSPVFNLAYGGFLGAYALINVALYRAGRMPSTFGKLPFETTHPHRAVWLIAVVALLLTLYGSWYANTAWFSMPPSPVRLLWLVIFTPLTALNFWMGHFEAYMLSEINAKLPAQIILMVLNTLPFWLIAPLIGNVNSLLILALVLLMGKLLVRAQQRLWVVAVAQAVVLYGFVLPLGVLFVR